MEIISGCMETTDVDQYSCPGLFLSPGVGLLPIQHRSRVEEQCLGRFSVLIFKLPMVS